MEEQLEHLKYPVGHFKKPEIHSHEQLREWINVLTALPSWMDACIENLDEHQLQTQYREGGWTIQQVVHHVADSHMNAYVRLKLAMTEDNPQIKPYDEKAWAEMEDTRNVPVNISVTLLHSLHRRWVDILHHMNATDWERTYFHPEHKRNVPLWEMTALYAWHSRHHTAHIMHLRERMGWK